VLTIRSQVHSARSGKYNPEITRHFLQICFRVIRDSCQESGVLSIAMKKVTKKKEIWAEKLQKSVFIKKKELKKKKKKN
jgi:hypothetical protein